MVMQEGTTWNTLPQQATIGKTITALQQNGITALSVETGEEAKKKVLELIPEGAEVLNMTSITLDTIGLSKEITESGKYKAVKKELETLDRKTQHQEMQKLGSAPEWAIGSVHAVTEDGHVFIASNTGSQLAAEVYGASHVIWVVGAQKIVKDNNAAMQRIYDHVLPIETQRARKAYGLPDDWNSFVSKLLIFNREVVPNRVTLIFVNEVLGF